MWYWSREGKDDWSAGKNFVVDDTLSVSASHSSKLAALSESDFRKHEQKMRRKVFPFFFFSGQVLPSPKVEFRTRGGELGFGYYLSSLPPLAAQTREASRNYSNVMQTVARKNCVPQRCSYVHSGKRCREKRCFHVCLLIGWLKQRFPAGWLHTSDEDDGGEGDGEAAAAPAPSSQRAISLLHLGYRKSIWGFEAGIWLPYRNSDQMRNQNNERFQSSTMAMCSSEKQSVCSVPALGTTSYTILLLFTNDVLFTPYSSQIYSFITWY